MSPAPSTPSAPVPTPSPTPSRPDRRRAPRGTPARWWSRQFARRYDALNRAAEEAGVAAWRSGLLTDLRGDVVEIGAGTGANLAHYPPDLASLTLVEPDPTMREILGDRLSSFPGPGATVVAAGAEDLPLADASADVVVCTYVLCSVDPERALPEIARVLRPGGRLVFLEHVRSSSARVARWQDRLDRLWSVLVCGCHCNRDTAALLAAAGYRIEEQQHGEVGAELALVRPTIRGSARVATPAA